MKVCDGFVLRRVAGRYVAVAVGERAKTFHGMIKLNETGKDIWEGLSRGLTAEEITDGLVKKNGADRALVAEDVAAMIREMEDAGLIEGSQ